MKPGKRIWELTCGAALVLLLAAWIVPLIQHQQLNRQLALELTDQGQHQNREESLVAIHRLLQQGADINTRAANGQTPLRRLASSHHPEWVAELLDRGVNANAAEPGTPPPLMLAGDPDTARLLLDHGAALEVKTPGGTETALHRAVLISPEVTRVLLERGAQADAKNGLGQTPLEYMLTYLNPDPRTVQLLLDHGADPTGGSHRAYSPAVLAAQRGSASCVEVLLAAGGDPDAGHPLAAAAVINSVPTIQALLRHGARIDARDDNGRSPLSNAAAAGAEQVVRCLVEHGANVNLKDVHGLTPLRLAAASGIPLVIGASGPKIAPAQRARTQRITAFLKQHGARP